MGILPKLLIIAAISLPLILALYELLVKSFNVVRFFFGMRPKLAAAAKPSANLPDWEGICCPLVGASSLPHPNAL